METEINITETLRLVKIGQKMKEAGLLEQEVIMSLTRRNLDLSDREWVLLGFNGTVTVKD